MFHIALDVEDDGPYEGFELGHITLSWDDGEYSSRQHDGRGLGMVYLAAGDLLSGTKKMLAHPDGSYQLVGAGTSWSFSAVRTRRDGIRVTTPAGRLLCQPSEQEYQLAVRAAVEQLLAQYPLPDHAAALDDIRAGLADDPRS